MSADPRMRGAGRRLGSLWLAALAALLSIALPSSRPAVATDQQLALVLAPDRVRQGGVSLLSVESPRPIQRVQVLVAERFVFSGAPDGQTRWGMLIGIDLEQTPGAVTVRAEVTDDSGRFLAGEASLRILDAHFPIQRLTVPRPFVELDAQALARVTQEKAALDRLWETLTPDRLWHERFRLPLEGATRGFGFGLRRIINGEPRSPHTGTDFTVSAGTPVLAANSGTVVLVAEHFFAGKSVVLDHGFGLYTMYFHLQETLVRDGQRVNRGQPIARVGSTGRATGPHLHWGARLLGARVDPVELLHIPPLE